MEVPPIVKDPANTPCFDVPNSFRKHILNILYCILFALYNCFGNVNSCADIPIIPSANCVT